MTTLHAQPYDISATGFYFENAEEFEQKSSTLRNDYGDPVEEFELQFIDGENIDSELAKAWEINQANYAHFFDAVDEWDEQRHLAQLGGKLRALMHNEKRVNWVIASTWMLSAEHGRFGSPFYAQTRSIELKAMRWEGAKTLVETLSERAGITWQNEALVTLLEQTALRPYLIQALGQRIYDALSQSVPPFSMVDMKTIRAVTSDFLRGARSQVSPFTFLWSEESPPKLAVNKPVSSLSWLGRLILLALDENAPSPLSLMEICDFVSAKLKKEKMSFPENFCDEIADTLNEMELIFDAVKKEQNRYTFSIPLSQAWFHHVARQYDDPWAFALQRFRQEPNQFAIGAKKEQK